MARLIEIHSDERVLFVSYMVVNIEIYFVSICRYIDYFSSFKYFLNTLKTFSRYCYSRFLRIFQLKLHCKYKGSLYFIVD